MQEIITPLLGWFALNKRELPWRQDRQPYHVWVSEIMLQQTRIEAVKKYYARFMEAVPDVRALSEIGDDALLKLWEGLGYYSRARNLKKAAVTVMEDYGGSFPRGFREIKALAGIGDYTAGAIASICFNERVPAVDGNVLRVTARVTGSRENVLLPEVKKRVTQQLSSIMPPQAGDFNEALMELGELVCLPNGEPDCAACPLQPHCAAFREGLTAELPVRIKKLRRGRAEKTVFLLTDVDGRIAIEKRAGQGLLAGMYQLPNDDGYYSEREIREILGSRGLSPVSVVFLGEAKHVFTHIDWFMKGYRVTVENPCGRYLWAKDSELQTDYALPTAFQKILKMDKSSGN